jgi:hypothetical protein
MKKINKINAALEHGKSVYIHALGNIGNGMRIDPDKKCYLTKYVYDEFPGMYYGTWGGTMEGIDGRRRIEIL